MKRKHNGRAGSIAVAWRPVSSSRISLPIEMHSLFLITGNLSLWHWKRWGILNQIAPGGSDIDKFPCNFPDHQGSSWRDEFAADCVHRQLVCGCRDFAAETRIEPRNPVVSAGFRATGLAKPNRRRRVSGLEDAAVGVCLCCEVGRFGFARGSSQRRAALSRFNGVPMGAGWCATARRRTSLYLGIGRVNHPRVGDKGEGEKLNNFNADEY